MRARKESTSASVSSYPQNPGVSSCGHVEANLPTA